MTKQIKNTPRALPRLRMNSLNIQITAHDEIIFSFIVKKVAVTEITKIRIARCIHKRYNSLFHDIYSSIYRISKINMTTFDSLENLKTLYLAYNNLTTLSGQPFQNLWFLETWDISHNKINNFDLNSGN